MILSGVLARGLIPICLAAAVVLLGTPPAHATFPGSNGPIVLSSWPSPAPPAEAASVTFINPSTGRARQLGLCPPDALPVPNSACEGGGPAAVSPDGRLIAFVMPDGPTASHAPATYALSVLPLGGES